MVMDNVLAIFLHLYLKKYCSNRARLGIRGTHSRGWSEWSGSNKKSHPMELRADSFKCDITRLIRGLWLYSGIKLPKNSHLDDSCVFFIRTDDFTWVPQIPGQQSTLYYLMPFHNSTENARELSRCVTHLTSNNKHIFKPWLQSSIQEA